MAPGDQNQADALTLLMERRNITGILTVFIDDVYGSGLNMAMNEKAANQESGFRVIKSIPFEPTLSRYDDLIGEIESAAEELPPDSGAILLIGPESQATGIFSSIGPESPLRDIKWFAGDGIIHEAGILNNPDAAAFAVQTRLEGVSFACEETTTLVPLMLATGLLSAELGSAPSPDALPAWEALWFIAEAYRISPDPDIGTLKTTIRSVFERGGNLFNQLTALDENGDLPAAKYARFTATEGQNDQKYWNLDGMFISSRTSGMFITDADGRLTHEPGNIVIGAVLPVTVANEEIGRDARKAIELAVDHANAYYSTAAGLDIRFTPDIRDSESKPETALAEVKALHEAGVKIIIMGGPSAELAAVQDYAAENDIIILATRSTAISLADPDDLIWRLTPDDSYLVRALVRLMEEQGKEHLVVLYRDDVYGRDFTRTLSAVFPGSMEQFGYPADETDFSTVLEDAASSVEKTGPGTTAVAAVGTTEVIRMLEMVSEGPLTRAAWYSTDGIATSRDLLTSDKAVSTALLTNLTCGVFDSTADQLFNPMRIAGGEYLSRAIGGKAGWNEISGYEAAWIAMNAHALTAPDASPEELRSIINNPYGAVGIGEQYVTNEAQDQSNSFYAFYQVTETPDGPAWRPVAYYRDLKAFPDDLRIIGW